MKTLFYIIDTKTRDTKCFNSLRKVSEYIQSIYPDITTISHNTISTRFSDKVPLEETGLPVLKYYDILIFKDDGVFIEKSDD